MAVNRKPCIYALVKSVYDLHFDTTRVDGVSLFHTWKQANKAMRDAYAKESRDEDFVPNALTAPLETSDMCIAYMESDGSKLPYEGCEVEWKIVKAETGGIR